MPALPRDATTAAILVERLPRKSFFTELALTIWVPTPLGRYVPLSLRVVGSLNFTLLFPFLPEFSYVMKEYFLCLLPLSLSRPFFTGHILWIFRSHMESYPLSDQLPSIVVFCSDHECLPLRNRIWRITLDLRTLMLLSVTFPVSVMVLGKLLFFSLLIFLCLL